VVVTIATFFSSVNVMSIMASSPERRVVSASDRSPVSRHLWWNGLAVSRGPPRRGRSPLQATLDRTQAVQRLQPIVGVARARGVLVLLSVRTAWVR